MSQNQAGMYKNNLSSHAALLLSASPTIVTSPLNNPQQSSSNQSDSNTNNHQQLIRNNHTVSSNEIAKRLAMNRRVPTIPLVSNHNLDQVNQAPLPPPPLEGPSTINTISNESYINFKKPQNEIFKKLDGKIQKIVAAHSNRNKLYALNDFSGIGSGPKRPFELPPQLPPPPPCIPKTTSPIDPSMSFTNTGTRKNPNSLLNASNMGRQVNTLMRSPGQLLANPKQALFNELNGMGSNLIRTNQSPSPTIDSAISKLHQRRQSNNAHPLLQNTHFAHQRRPNVGQPGPIKQIRPVNRLPDSIAPNVSSTPKQTASNISGQTKPNKVDPAIMRLMAQRIREALENDNGPKNHQQSSSASTVEEKKKFQVDLINLLRRDISVMAKSSNIDFSRTPQRPPPAHKSFDQKSLLRTSPQSLFNTIHRETSLLLKQRESIRSTLSITPTHLRANKILELARNGIPSSSQQDQQQIFKTPSTIKLVLPPTEFLSDDINKTDASASPRKTSLLRPAPSYQFIKNKLRLFQLKNHISLSKVNPNQNSSLIRPKKIGGLKTLDKIVDRLQAKSSSRSSLDKDEQGSFDEDLKSLSFQQKIVNTSANLIRNSHIINNTMTLDQTPIPVFRLPYGTSAKNIYYNRSNALKALSLKSKKNKKIHNLGLILSSYLERELEQPTQDRITVDDYARGLNLVRPNDVSLQKHKERLLQSESRWKLPLTNRPVRLRRLRGERIHMPASASYRAASKAGLQ